MKKYLALLFAVLMLFTSFAFSESVTVEAVEFVSEHANYAMMIPADFVPVNDSFISMIESRISNGQLEGIDADQIQQLQNALNGVDLSSLDMILSRSLTGNINIQVQSIGIPGSMLPDVKAQMDASNIASYATIGVSEDSITTYDMEEYGNYNWYHLSCVLLERDIQQYITADENGTGYILTFTGIEEPDIDLILSTFAFKE